MGCSSGPPTYPYAKEPNPLQQEYVIGVSDLVHVEVWQHDEFRTHLVVRPDGRLTMPLIGDIQAAGLTPSELAADIKTRLSQFIKDKPTVNVSVPAINSYYVTVAGRVGAPGRFESGTYLRFSDALALAGGPTPFASPDDAFILRTGANGKTRKIPVNYRQVLNGEHLEQDLYLLRGDQLVVP